VATATKKVPTGAPPANRLPRAATPANRGREVRLGVVGALGLLVFVAGIPVALCVFVGYPLPRTAPSRDWLTASISSTFVINVLACVVWVVWAHFVVCLIAEWRAVRRGRLPGAVPFGGGSQVLARRLVAAALLLGGVAAVVPHSSSSPGRTLTAAAPPSATHSAATASSAEDLDKTLERAPATDSVKTLKYYVVQPPDGRRYDSLWDIAKRTLGDPLRYKEIFALNKDRTQTDGRTLVDANLIQPGWQLRLPGDASGPGVHVLHEPPTAVPDVPATPTTPTKPQPRPAPAKDGADPATTPAVSAEHHGVDQTSLLLGGGLMLAGILVALSARRGPYGEQAEDEGELAKGADPELARLLDRALRSLAVARTAQVRDLPHPVVAWVSTERIVLHLAGGDMTNPPAPWGPGGNGRSWTLDPRDVPGAGEGPAPFPGLVSVGRSHGFEVFVDLEQAPGLIGVGGDLVRAREVVLALAVQAATSSWSDGARVTLVGFGDGAQLTQIAPQLITEAPHLDAVLAEAEHEADQMVDLQRRLAVRGVLGGRQARQPGDWRPRVIVLSGPPTPDEAARLQRLTGPERTHVVALAVGDAPSARWRFAVDDQGLIDLGVLGATAQAYRLTSGASTRIAELMRQAGEGKRQAANTLDALVPATAAAGLAPAPSVTAPPAATVSLLGPVVVEAPGPIDPAKRDLATEIVVAAALHPAGLHDAVLRSAIWPRGVGDDVAAAAMTDVQAWLGIGAEGRPRIAQEQDGQWRLAPDVATDWDELRRRAAAATGAAELATLHRAVELFRGEAFSGTPAGRYGWLAFARAARDARVLGTTVTRRAAVILVEQGRRADAADLLRRGLLLIPTAELIWRDLLVLTSWDGPGGAAVVAEQMYTTLRLHRTWPEPETDALVAQAAPGYRRDQPA